MKKYILFGLTLLMAFPVYVSAQEDDTEDEAEVAVRVIKKKQKEYTTREVRGRVLNATTGSCDDAFKAGIKPDITFKKIDTPIIIKATERVAFL